MLSSAMLPTPILINKDRLRVFVGFCDKLNVGRVGFVDVDPNDPSKILSISKKPVFDIGNGGAFDDNGVVPISIVRLSDNIIYLYYIGFQLGVKVPYYMFCGLAISKDNGESFERYSKSPILDRVNDEIFARCGCHVKKMDGKFKMWYVGSIDSGWVKKGDKSLPLYSMKYIESIDGINWDESKSIKCMNFENSDEHGFGRPYVFKEKGVYKMYYSVRTFSRGYFIGYAESFDGIEWSRMDYQAGISISESGWDSTNISYPHLLKHKDKTYMFYNGNSCGKSGFGYAETID